MMAIVWFFIMVGATIASTLLGITSYRFAVTHMDKDVATTAILCIFFAGVALIAASVMIEEAEHNYKKRQRKA